MGSSVGGASIGGAGKTAEDEEEEEEEEEEDELILCGGGQRELGSRVKESIGQSKIPRISATKSTLAKGRQRQS